MSLPVNQQQAGFYSVNGQQVPPEGPRAVPLVLDFSLTTEYDLNLQNMESRNFITMIQSMFIDNSQSQVPFMVSFPNTGQTIQVAPNRQGYFQVLCPNPASMSFLSNGGAVVKVQLLNFPVSQHEWPCITGA